MTDNGLAALAAALPHDRGPFWDEYQPSPFVHESVFNRERYAAAILGERGVFLADGHPPEIEGYYRVLDDAVKMRVEIEEQAATIAGLRAENQRLQESFIRQHDCDHSPCIDDADALRAVEKAARLLADNPEDTLSFEERWDALRAALATAKEI
jgi:hypothetical protein